MSPSAFDTGFKAFLRDERGATAIEYALIGGLVSIAIIAGAAAVGDQLNTRFTSVAAKIPTPN